MHRPVADAFYRSMTVLVVASPCALVVARIASFDSEGEKAVLRRAASVAHFSTHPLARAIVAEAGKRNLPINSATDF